MNADEITEITLTINEHENLLDLINDIANDHEFLFDMNLDENSNILNQILVDNTLLKTVLNSIKLDYEHDIEMEKRDGESFEYLLPVYDEVILLLKNL